AKIQHEEGDVAHDVNPAHGRVELDAAEQGDRIVHQRDVAKMQVTVALADVPVGLTGDEFGGTPRSFALTPGRELPEFGPVGGVDVRRLHRGEILAGVGEDASWLAVRRAAGSAGETFMKRGDFGCQFLDT